ETPSPDIGRVAKQDTTLPNGELIAVGVSVSPIYGGANVDPAVFWTRWRCVSTARRTRTSPSVVACIAASAATWPAASCASRCASGTPDPRLPAQGRPRAAPVPARAAPREGPHASPGNELLRTAAFAAVGVKGALSCH